MQGSLDRLNQKSVDLYQIHWPGFPVLNSWANDAFCKGLIKCHQQGLAKAVGVSNYNVNRLQRANSIFTVRIWSFSSSSPLLVVSCSPLLHHVNRLQHPNDIMKVRISSSSSSSLVCCVLFSSSSSWQQAAAHHWHYAASYSSSLLLCLSAESCGPLLHHVKRLQLSYGILFFIMLASCEASSNSSMSG